MFFEKYNFKRNSKTPQNKQTILHVFVYLLLYTLLLYFASLYLQNILDIIPNH